MPKNDHQKIYDTLASHLNEAEHKVLRKTSKQLYSAIKQTKSYKLNNEEYYEKLGLGYRDGNNKINKAITAKRAAIHNPKEVFTVFNAVLALFKNGQEHFEGSIYIPYSRLMKLPTLDKEHILKKLVINTDISPKDYKKYSFNLPLEKLDVPTIRILLENDLSRDSRVDDIYYEPTIDAFTFAKDTAAEIIFGFSYSDHHRPLHKALHRICDDGAPHANEKASIMLSNPYLNTLLPPFEKKYSIGDIFKLGLRSLIWLVTAPLLYTFSIMGYMAERDRGLSLGILPLMSGVIGGPLFYLYQIAVTPITLVKYFTADTIRNRAHDSEHFQTAEKLKVLQKEIDKDFSSPITLQPKSILKTGKKQAEFFTQHRTKHKEKDTAQRTVRFSPGTKD